MPEIWNMGMMGSGTIVPITFDPEENYIITAYNDGTIIIWDYKNGKRISQLGENYDGVNSISFGENGQVIIASYDDGYIRIWDLKEKGCICEIEEKGKRMIRANVYNQSIVALSDDGIIFKWPFQPLQTLIDETSERFKNRQLSLEEREKYYLE
jgi:WD40 repeat protein